MKGKNDNLEWGTWNAECDRCGFKFKAHDLKEEWTGWMVCDQCYEPRHPQDFLRGMPDDPSVPWTRAEDRGATSITDVGGNTITSAALETTVYTSDPGNKTFIVGTDTPIQVYNTSISVSRTITLSSTGAKHNDSFIIYNLQDLDGYFLLGIGAPISTPVISTSVYDSVNGWTETSRVRYDPIS